MFCLVVRETYMLINEQNSNVLSLTRVAVKYSLDGGVVCLGVDDEEVFFGSVIENIDLLSHRIMSQIGPCRC